MRNKDLKKGKESIIGKIIYGFLLFMPLLAILSTILVNTFNKEVTQPTQEAEITYKYDTNEVNTLDDLVIGNIYHLDSFGIANLDLRDQDYFALNILYYDEFIFDASYSTDEFLYNTYTSLDYNFIYTYFYVDGQDLIIGCNYTNNETHVTIYYEEILEFEFTDLVFFIDDSDYLEVFKGQHFVNLPTSTDFNVIESVEITTHDTSVNDIFYYAVDKVENSNLFNWATNSIIYTGIHNTCTQLSITTTFVPMLLAYWLIISVIYILYDIILMILIILHNRIHRLQESI